MTGVAAADQTFFRSPRYQVRSILNLAAPSNVAEVDLSSTDYAPGTPFVVHVVDTTSGTAVKVDTVNGDTVTLTGIAGERLGGWFGVICTKVYKTGTTADTVLAFS